MITANKYWQSLFGCKVYRLAVEGGKTCPNRDGTCGVGGCSFCAEGSGSFAQSGADINAQLDSAKMRVLSKCPTDSKFIAYFQSYTATHGDTDLLFDRLRVAALREDICAISVATRPDCLPESVINGLAEIGSIKPIYVELGLQTADNRVASLFNRGYDTEVYIDACRRLKVAGINIITHMIIGLPEQTEGDIVNTARLISQTAGGIKIQLLHVLKGTPLAESYLSGKYRPLELDEYIDLLCLVMDNLADNTVVHRLTGDGDKRLLLAPMWSADKKTVLNTVNRELKKRGF